MPRKYFPFYFTFREAGKTMPPRLRATFYEAIIKKAPAKALQTPKTAPQLTQGTQPAAQISDSSKSA